MNELPKNWVNAKIGDVIADAISGAGFAKEYQGLKSGEYPFAKVGDISRHFRSGLKYIHTADHYIDESIKQKLKAKIFPKDTIVFAKIGEALKNNYRVICAKAMLFDNNVMGLVPDNRTIETKYLFYLLTTKDFGEFSVATAVPSVRRGDVEAIAVPLPPLNEQKRIVAKIEELFSELDKGIENLKTAWEQLKVYRQAVLKHAFEGKLTANWRERNEDKLESANPLFTGIKREREAQYHQQLAAWQKGAISSKPRQPKEFIAVSSEEIENLPKLPADWAWAKIISLFDVISGGTPKGIEETKGSEIPFYKVSDMNNAGNEIRMHSAAIYLSDAERANLGLTCYPAGTVIFPKRGGAILTNKKRMLSRPSCFDLNIMGVVNTIPSISVDYVWHWFQKLNLANIYDGSNVPQINNKNVEPLPFPICIIEEQKEIVRVLDGYISAIESNEKEINESLQKSEALRQSILKKAFSGKLVKQDPKDEPASALLERIRAEKNRYSQTTKSRNRKKLSGTSEAA